MLAALVVLGVLALGCAQAPPPGTYFDPAALVPLPPVGQGTPIAGAAMMAPNPVFIPTANYEWAWDQIVDVVDDFFIIDVEQRVQPIGDFWSEGRIDTFPRGGATYLEPHRRDSIGRYNRLESTLQTIQRRATLHVRPEPAPGGMYVEVNVEKDLEDLPRPEHATAGAATFRNDTFEDNPDRGDKSRDRRSPSGVKPQNWIPIARDIALEQQILAEISARLGGPVGH